MATGRAKLTLIVISIVLIILALWGAAFVIARRPSRLQTQTDWNERTLIEGSATARIAMITVAGEIFSDPLGEAVGASDENIIQQLHQAKNDDSVVAVILDLNTPGGGVVASDNIYRELTQFKKDKPAVALMEDTAASGGYYIASATNEIVSNPATVTGSIGVIMIIPNVAGTAEKLGIKPVVIKSGQFKDIASPFRDMTSQERSILQATIDEAYGQFVDAVSVGRKMDPNRVRQIADGRIYTGKQAKELGLVDYLGGRRAAVERAERLAKVSGSSVFVYEKPKGLAQSLLGANTFTNPLNSKNILQDTIGLDLEPGLKFLWLP